MLNNKSQAPLYRCEIGVLYALSMSIGKRLRQLRLQNNLTQEQVGVACEVTKGMVSQWESDMVTPPVDRVIKLRGQIEFSADWLLFGDAEANLKLRPTLRELLRIADRLPDNAVAKLTREGDTYAELIEDAKEQRTGAPRGACPGYIVDHIIPLCAGGADHPSNMQWQTIAEAKAKDKIEIAQCR